MNTHFASFKEYYRAGTGIKHSIPSDILIDDLDLNIVEFVKSNPHRHGVLFLHPWSINGTEIEKYLEQVHFWAEWESVVRAIHEIDAKKSVW